MEEVTIDKKEKKKKKKEKTKLLLGCIDIPSSNEESYIQTNDDSKLTRDEKKEEKKKKKLAKIAARIEKKEKKKRKKIDEKLGIGMAEGGDETSAQKEKKKDKKEKRKDKKERKKKDSSGRVTPIGDDSVVVVELSVDTEEPEVGMKRKLEGIVPKSKKKKRKIEETEGGVSEVAEINDKEGKKEKKKKKKKDKKLKKKKVETIPTREAAPKTSASSLGDSTINSANVSELISPAVSVADIQPKANAQETPAVDAPNPPDRPKKKKKKTASDAESRSASNGAESDVPAAPLAADDDSTPATESTPATSVVTPVKEKLVNELKEKVKKKKRKSDEVLTSSDLTASTTPSTRKDEEVFETPTKSLSTPAAKPSLGQWGTVELGSTEKTQKFFRLLGGLKKPTGSPLSFRSSKGSDGEEGDKAIMALGKKDADQLNNKLEEQFKKALGGIGKGKVGLGFSPQLDPTNKKFHIDVNATNSLKF